MKEIGSFMGITVYREVDDRNRETIYLQSVGYREPMMFLAPGETFNQFVEGYRNLMMDPKERVIKAALAYVKGKYNLNELVQAVDALKDSEFK
jgi:hypothetical protein